MGHAQSFRIRSRSPLHIHERQLRGKAVCNRVQASHGLDKNRVDDVVVERRSLASRALAVISHYEAMCIYMYLRVDTYVSLSASG